MTTRIIASPLDFEVAHIAYNVPHTVMAATDGRNTIAIWNKDGDSKRWAFSSSIETQGLKATCITLSAPEFGNIICIGTSDGFVCIWAQTPDNTWQLRARLSASSHAATAACFAPRHMGPLVALSFADGYVRTFAASAPLNADSWTLHSEFLVDDTGAAACTCVSWKDSSSIDTLGALSSMPSPSSSALKSGDTNNKKKVSLPPLLAVGTSTGTAHVFMYHEAFLRWYHVAHLSDGDNNNMNNNNMNNNNSTPMNNTTMFTTNTTTTTINTNTNSYSSIADKEIAAIAWAPTLGRPTDIIAVAIGHRIILWSLEGVADQPTVKQITVLDHSDDVWQVEWNMMGTWLAASTEGGEVCMWRPDLAGEWMQWNKIVEGDGGSGGGGGDGQTAVMMM